MMMPVFKIKSRKGWTLCENCITPILKGKNKRFCEKCLKGKQKAKKGKQKAKNHRNYLKQVAMGWRHY